MNRRARTTVGYGGCLLLACLLGFGAISFSLARPVPAATTVTMVGAGDIADCGNTRDEATARLLGRIRGTIFTLGDNVYDRGTRAEFRNCYAPSWGKYKKRTRPAAGNHEYYTNNAAPYYNYFGARAGNLNKGYYSYNRGAWHVVVLNSNCDKVDGCGTTSRQGRWLRADLARDDSKCTLAYFHHPLYASGDKVQTESVRPFWNMLHADGADVILAGHAHRYERFAPQTPAGVRSPKNGIRQFIVGTGGKPPSSEAGPSDDNSQILNDNTPGVLKLNLGTASYNWKFVPIAGKKFTDSGSDRCH
ncbi:MAG: metallophosphoesterase [Rubrobacter sp.]|nr:metallophosphoesterase [Rubrobacter sp.]